MNLKYEYGDTIYLVVRNFRDEPVALTTMELTGEHWSLVLKGWVTFRKEVRLTDIDKAEWETLREFGSLKVELLEDYLDRDVIDAIEKEQTYVSY